MIPEKQLKNEFSVEKKIFFNKKELIKSFFYKSNKGLLCCKKLSNITDSLISTIYKRILDEEQLSEKKLVLLAIGGYGRKHLAPFSDLDILFVTLSSEKRIEKIVQRILYFLWDSGFKVGHAVRNLDEITDTASHDMIIQTSLLDYRKICGEISAFKSVSQKIDNFFKKEDKNVFLKNKLSERKLRLEKTDSNSYLLEPNIKECSGGLRDINILFWYFKRFYNTSSLEKLFETNIISKIEMLKIRKSLDFILTIRFYLHFLSNRATERLTFDFQKMISENMKYKSRESNLGVERLMKHYYLQIKNVKNLLQCIPREEKLEREISTDSRFLTDGVVVEDRKISIQNFIKFKEKSENFINIFLDSNKFNIQIHQNSFRFLCEETNNLDKNFRKNFLVTKNFLELLKMETNDHTFNDMNDCGLLVKIIPEFSKIISQTQFDRYHLYTVDEHTLRALNLLKSINSERTQSEKFNFPKKIIREIKDSLPLYLSVLLHDVGKGNGGRHEEHGIFLARKILRSLRINKKVSGEVIWLIKNHLIFSDFALNKDIADEHVIKSFVKLVGNAERLKFLYLLTIVDMASVNSTTWNNWKSMLLNKLFKRSKLEISKPILMKLEIFQKKKSRKIALIQKKVFSLILKNNEKYFKEFCKITDDDYWLLQSIKEISEQINYFFKEKRKTNSFDCSISYDVVDKFFDVTLVTTDRKNLLLKVVENFISNEMEIFEARIFTFKNNTILDSFKLAPNPEITLSNQDFENKRNTIAKGLKKLLIFKQKKNSDSNQKFKFNKVLVKKVNVSIDNDFSNNYSIIKVFSNNRPFLLYDILKVLLNYKLTIFTAKISTYEDFAEDTFHVLKHSGEKIKGNYEIQRLERDIKHTILERA